MKRVLQYLVIGLVMAVLSPSAQAQYDYGMDYRFQSTSTMQGSGSVYRFQSTSTMQGSGSVYASVAVTGGATTTYDDAQASAAHAAARKSRPEDWPDPFPIGDGWFLLVLAAAAGGAIALRQRKRG